MTNLRSQSTNHTSGNHTVFLHRYHIIRITKYRYKKLEGALQERIRTIIRHVMCAKNRTSRLYPVFCRENMSKCTWKSRRILRSGTSCGVSRSGRCIGCRWSSWNCASASGLGVSSPPKAAASRTMSYFSIFRSTNLPASAGSYSVI
jgi:hypothetical protein